MPNSYEIRELETVLKPFIGSNKILVNYNAVPLTNPGENYGSLILAVTATVKNKEINGSEVVNMVAKMCPNNETLKVAFNVKVTVKKEIIFYASISKILRHFAHEYNIGDSMEFFATYYGSRLSLDPYKTTVDDDAVLILENLKMSGFINVDRLEGFDYETTKFILQRLALFHAVSLAFKLLKQEQFQKEILPHLNPGLDLNNSFSSDVEAIMIDNIVKSTSEADPRCAKLSTQIREMLETQLRYLKDYPPGKEPYSTIIHSDLWINNIMIKFINKKPYEVKFVDFQLYMYDSLAKDLIFFLLTSVKKSILSKNYNNFVRCYQEKLVEILHHFGCSTKLYSLDLLNEEIESVIKTSEMFHILTMHKPIFSEKGTIKDLENFDTNDFVKAEGSDLYKKRLSETILFFVDKGWL